MARVYGMTSQEVGEERGRRNSLREQLEAKFGPLSESARQRLTGWLIERVREVSLTFFKVNSLAELGLEEPNTQP